MNKISFGGLERIWTFSEPILLRYMAVTAGIVFLSYLGAFVGVSIKSSHLFSISLVIIMLPFYFGPAAFSFFRDRTLTTQLPVTANDKFVFMVIFCYCVIPLTMFMAWVVPESIFRMFGAPEITIDAYKQMIIDDVQGHTAVVEAISSMKYAWMRAITELLPVAVCMYIVVAARRQRFMLAFAGIVGTNVALGFVSGLYTAVKMVNYIFVNRPHDISEPALMEFIFQCVRELSVGMVVLLPVLTVVVLCMTWHKIKRFQI